MKRFLSSILSVLAAASAVAQGDVAVPRLVVGIAIDQLRTDYLEAFGPLYGEGGLKRLMREGVVFSNIRFSSLNVDRASSVAGIYTGTCPFNHGIVAEDWLDRSSLRPVHCVDDFKVKGVNTRSTTSPQHLLASTLSDELKMGTNGDGLVYSVAPYRECAVLAAGHAADWALWLDDETGAWAGSSYYGTPPTWTRYLDAKSVSNLANTTWKATNSAVEHYNYYFSSYPSAAFTHRFTGANRYRQYMTSGLVNMTVTQTASFVLNQSGMGRDDVPDLLSLCYYAGTWDGKPVSEVATELQDTYVRLDAAIENLLNEVDKTVGLRHTLFFVTSTGYQKTHGSETVKYRIPTGIFHINRCAALLNMYLTATYGQGKFVEAYYGNQLYLNHKLIEQKQLNLAKVLETCENFLSDFEGVRDVFTSTRLNREAGWGQVNLVRNSYNSKCSGDIIIQPNPGWNLVNEDLAQSTYVNDSNIDFPLIFFGFGLKPKRVQSPVYTDCIAPTVAHFMRIRAPNACSSSRLDI